MALSRKQRKNSEHLLALGTKVLEYRGHALPGDVRERLATLVSGLHEDVRHHRKAAGIPNAERCEGISLILRDHGGIYCSHPQWVEWVEMLAVAAILAIGVRTFFLQPFRIPTNSMYPTYHGVTTELHPGDKPPEFLEAAWRKVTLGASAYTLRATGSGYLRIPVRLVSAPDDPGKPAGLVVLDAVANWEMAMQAKGDAGPRPLQSLRVLCGSRDSVAVLALPGDFRASDTTALIMDRFFPDAPNWTVSPEAGREWIASMVKRGQIVPDREHSWLIPSEQFNAGQNIVSFDVLTGDWLFVDRMSYHFTKPSLGDPFVFRTREIPEFRKNGMADTYYIKRLAGRPGDTVEIRDPALFVNGEQAKGNPGFDLNAARTKPYDGYLSRNLQGMALLNHGPETLPKGSFLALGDNSDQSYDSRMWGLVPERAIVGRAVVIHYPFSKRWGLAK